MLLPAATHFGYSNAWTYTPRFTPARLHFSFSCRSLLFWQPARPHLRTRIGRCAPHAENVSPGAYADYVLEIADTNKNESITLVEWTNAGGDKRSFLLVDQNKDDVVTRTELVRISSNGKFLEMTRRYADFNKDNRLTPREFRSSAGVRLLRFEF